MQEFIAERNNGTTTTTAVDQALMKTFKDASAIDLAIQAGIVNEGEIISTIEDDRPHTLPIDQLREMQEEIRELQEDLRHIDASSGSASSLSAETTARQDADTALGGRIDDVNDKISTTATSSDRCPAASEVTSEISSAITTEVGNRNTAITNAINGLDVAAAGGAGKFIKAISQTDGKISATEGTLSMTLSGNDLYITFA